VHTGIDGDVLFALAFGSVPAHADVVGVLAADALAQAIANGVRAACSGYGLPCAADLDTGTA
jgi:L-aminopeptidase/D-esterase-like protein